MDITAVITGHRITEPYFECIPGYTGSNNQYCKKKIHFLILICAYYAEWTINLIHSSEKIHEKGTDYHSRMAVYRLMIRGQKLEIYLYLLTLYSRYVD